MEGSCNYHYLFLQKRDYLGLTITICCLKKRNDPGLTEILQSDKVLTTARCSLSLKSKCGINALNELTISLCLAMSVASIHLKGSSCWLNQFGVLCLFRGTDGEREEAKTART